ncbi:MAG: hypothetical protein OXT67_05540, partial [Zetaproteobacteria bacterium]|nr:hypothetical protein [Zetaproteobacteria bacterium]
MNELYKWMKSVPYISITTAFYDNQTLLRTLHQIISSSEIPPPQYSSNALTEEVQHRALIMYPYLLLEKQSWWTYNTSSIIPEIRKTEEKINKIISLIERNKGIYNLTNKVKSWGLSFDKRYTCNHKHNLQAAFFAENLIRRSFENTCLRMQYSLTDLFHEIDTNITFLVKVGSSPNPQQQIFPSFTGVQGVG